MKSRLAPPLFNPKKFVKLAELAREMGVNYRSIFLKQKRLAIFATKCLDKKTDRLVVCFTHAQAKQIKKATADSFNPKTHTEIRAIEKEFKLTRAKIKKVLDKLGLKPIKARKNDKAGNPRSILVVKNCYVKRIKSAIKYFFE